MSPQALAATLPGNLRYLSSLIARKPREFTGEWAASAEEAFSLYTRTSTVNLILSWNDLLAEYRWPFPAYLDLREEAALARFWPLSRWKLIRALISGRNVLQTLLAYFAFSDSTEKSEAGTSAAMTFLFSRHSKRVFRSWRENPLLRGREPVVDDIRATYRRGLFAACLPTALGLLDFIMREYFQTNRLDVSLQTLRNAFDKARILPRHLKPGYGVWDLTQETESSILFSSLDEDLRLPGVFLSSFVEFGSSYYAWYKIADETPSTLNRHAIMHCASKYWAPHNAARLLTFLDLSLRLERVLKIVIHGSAAYRPTEENVSGV
jgi:hypothetical protein